MKANDELARQRVKEVFENLLSDETTRSELTYLIGQAEDAETWTWVSSLGVHLASVAPDASAKRDGENPEKYVRRVIKFLISKESKEGTAAAVEDLLSEMESMRGEASLLSALKIALRPSSS